MRNKVLKLKSGYIGRTSDNNVHTLVDKEKLLDVWSIAHVKNIKNSRNL